MDAGELLDAPVTVIEGATTRAANALRDAFGIVTVRDLLEHYPAQEPGKYRDAGAQMLLRDARLGEPVTVVGTLSSWRVDRPSGRGGGRGRGAARGRRDLTIARATVVDDAGSKVEASFFNQEWRARQTPEGTRVAVSGTLERFRDRLQLKNPKLAATGEDAGLADDERIQATYPATEAIGSSRIARLVAAALDALPPGEDFLPEELRARHDLAALDAALRAIHRPGALGDEKWARRRLVYDELLCLQVGLQERRHRLEADAVGLPQPPVDGGLAGAFLEGLPFAPTGDQRRAFGELGRDLARAKPMHRLLQGDVGTGKTLVAVWAMLCSVDHGHQAVLMAPTEVLAEQHYRTLSRLLAPLGVGAPGGPRLELLTGSTGAARLRGLLAEVAVGDVPLLVGTHAVLEDRVVLADLGVVVIDEQHRFGVEHRTRLRDKRGDGRTPDVLVMTATPIPRSLALTIYGDLDVTVLEERPVDVDVTTVVRAADDQASRAKLYAFMRERITAGERAYVVCPTIEESEALGVAAATDVFRRLSEDVFADFAVGLVHGRLPVSERDRTMEAFRSGEVQVLVATTVIEVGVDVGEATFMLIEDADRFGISQLHQLRGRLYRGLPGNYCVLFDGRPGDEPNPRLEALAQSSDGFRLAEIDLELRGEGSLFDTRQSGLPDLKLARLVRDAAWVARTRDDARALVAGDPGLLRHPALRREVARRYGEERLAALETG
jgi:ATP-dependent DNA helicase RecG